MGIFTDSIHQGLQKYEAKLQEQLEINNAIDQLDNAIKTATSGTVKLIMDITQEQCNKFILGAKRINPELYSNRNGGYFAEIAFSDIGYPCTLSFGKNNILCLDKAGLSDAICKMMENNLVASVIHKQWKS